LIWAREARLLADEVIHASQQAGADPRYLSELKTACTRHIARSTANQFVWTRIRGASMSDTLSWSVTCLPYLSWTLPALTRLGAALLLPRKFLRSKLLSAAAKLGASRRENESPKAAKATSLS
jgi:hypothetical protein